MSLLKAYANCLAHIIYPLGILGTGSVKGANEMFCIDDGNDNDEKGILNIDAIKDTSEVIEFKFRPRNFDEYIGQTKTKSLLKKYIEATKARNKVFPHLLLNGKAGTGKTTLARILAKELNVNFVEIIGSEITDMEKVVELLAKVDGGILFIDEIHSVDRLIAEKMYTLIEDFTIDGQKIKDFTLIGATTEIGEIIKNRKPFYDRFKIIRELEDYTNEELAIIVKQYKENVFKNDLLTDDVYVTIADNARLTPRHSLRLLDSAIYFNGDIDAVLVSFNVIYKGFTTIDLKVLKYLNENEKGIGLQGLISFLDTSQDNYEYAIEPYLLRSGLIARTPRGRKITLKGIGFIAILESKVKGG
jgi:Holliday junction DNA helicase RuvB